MDAELITAHRRPPVSVVDDTGATVRVDYGHVGDIDRVDPRVLVTLMDARMVPVVASLAGGEGGEVYNVNADTVAESLAVALRAQKLIFLTGAPGVLRDRADPSTLVTFAEEDNRTVGLALAAELRRQGLAPAVADGAAVRRKLDLLLVLVPGDLLQEFGRRRRNVVAFAAVSLATAAAVVVVVTTG